MRLPWRLPKDERNFRKQAISDRITLIQNETRDQVSQEDSGSVAAEFNVAGRNSVVVEADTPQQDSGELISSGEQVAESAIQPPDEEIRALQLIDSLTHEKNKLLSIKESKPKAEVKRQKAIAAIDEKIGNLKQFIEIQPGCKVTKKNGNTEGTVTEKNISPGGMPHIFVLWGESTLPISEAISVVNYKHSDAWNPKHFGETPRQQDEMGNPLIFFDTTVEPPEPDDYSTIEAFETAWDKWVATQEGTSEEELAHISADMVWLIEQDLDDPWDLPQQWMSMGVECKYENSIVHWGDKYFRVPHATKKIYLNPRVLIDFLKDAWIEMEYLARHLKKSPHTQQEIIQHFGWSPQVCNKAIALGIDLGFFIKKGDKYELCSDNLIYVLESVPASPMPACNSENSTSSELPKQTDTVQISCQKDFPESTTTATLKPLPTLEDLDSTAEKSISSQLQPHVSPSPSKEADKEAKMNEIASPQSSKSSINTNPDSLPLKMSPDSLPAPTDRVVRTGDISGEYSLAFTEVGTMRSGFVAEADTLKVPSLEKDYFWLESPAALSAPGKNRRPGQSRLESHLRKLNMLQKGECINPMFLEDCFTLPEGWTDPSVLHPASQLLATDAPPLVMPLIQDVQPLPSAVSSTSIPYVESDALKAITLHQPWASLVGVTKLFETRGWSTDYRGKIAIHAAKKQKDTDKACEQLSDLLPLRLGAVITNGNPQDHTASPKTELVFGAIVAIAELTDCILMDENFISQQSETEIRCGLWRTGRYAWKLENIQILPEPIPAKGKQGLWDIQIPIPKNNPLPKIRTDFQIGDHIEFLCDVSFGDVNTNSKNPNGKLALKGEYAEVCGVGGTRLALSVGGEPFDWPISLVKKVALLPDSLGESVTKTNTKPGATIVNSRPETGEASSSIGTQHQFVRGDHIVCKHPLSLGQIFEIAEYPSVYANGSISYESLVTTTNLVLGVDQVECFNPNPVASTVEISTLELDELAQLIKSQQEEFEASRQEYESATVNHLEKNIRLGHILNAAKAKVKKSKIGRWLKWLENNCPQINERTARLAMRLARNEATVREKSVTVADFGVRKAASLLNKDPQAKVTPMKRRSKCHWKQNPDGSRRYEVDLCGVKRELQDTYQQVAVEIERASQASDRTPEELIVEGLIKLVAENHGISEQGAIALAIEVATKINAAAA